MNKKNITIIIIIISIIVIFFAFFYRGEILFNLGVPADIKINKKEFKERDSLKKGLWPNDYEIIVSKKGYKDYEKTIKVKPFQKIVLEIDLDPKLEVIDYYASSIHFSDENTYYHNSSEKVLTKLNLKTLEKTQVSNKLAFYVKKIIWAPRGERAIIFSDENWPKAFLFNPSTKDIKEIAGDYEPIGTWSENSKNLLFISFNLEGYHSIVLLSEEGNIRKIKSPVQSPSLLEWWDKNNIAAYASTSVGDANYVFEILNTESGQTIFKNNDYIKRINFITSTNSVIYEALNKQINTSTLKILNLNTGDIKDILSDNIKKWVIINNKLAIINSEAKLSLLGLDGNPEKKYGLTDIYDNDLDNINNFYIFEDKLFLDIGDSLYSLILKEEK